MTALAARVDPAAQTDLAVIEAVQRFARRELHPLQTDRQGHLDPSTLEGLEALGVFGLTLPTAHGGLGAGLPLATEVVRTLAEVDRSVAVTVGLHLGLGTRALVRYGGAALQAELVPPLSTGACIAAFATTEPGAGSDLSRLATRVHSDGAWLRVSGEKAYVTNGGLAGLLTVTAASLGDPGLERGLTMLALPASAPGVGRGPEERKLGLKGSSTTGFVLDAVRVPRRFMLGEPSTGARQLEHTLSWGRTLMAAGCVGAAVAALRQARDHTALRRQFGKALEAQPVVRGQLAGAAVRCGAMQALVAHTASQTDDAALHRWSVSAKVFASEQGSQVVDTALQLHGASGYLEDTGLALMLRDMRVTRIFEGANDVLLTHAGALELQRPAGQPQAPACAGARAIAERVARRAARLRALGVRVFQRPEQLHQLGVGVVWRDAVDAGCRAVADPAWQATLCREAFAALRESERRLHPADELARVLEVSS